MGISSVSIWGKVTPSPLLTSWGQSLVRALRFFSPVGMAVNSQRKGTVFVPPPSYPGHGGDLRGPDLGATRSGVQTVAVLHSECRDLLSSVPLLSALPRRLSGEWYKTSLP